MRLKLVEPSLDGDDRFRSQREHPDTGVTGWPLVGQDSCLEKDAEVATHRRPGHPGCVRNLARRQGPLLSNWMTWRRVGSASASNNLSTLITDIEIVNRFVIYLSRPSYSADRRTDLEPSAFVFNPRAREVKPGRRRHAPEGPRAGRSRALDDGSKPAPQMQPRHPRGPAASCLRSHTIGRRHEAGEAILRYRSAEIVADASLMLEELSGRHGTDGVAAPILGPRPAAPVSIEAGKRIGAARLQLAA